MPTGPTCSRGGRATLLPFPAHRAMGGSLEAPITPTTDRPGSPREAPSLGDAPSVVLISFLWHIHRLIDKTGGASRVSKPENSAKDNNGHSLTIY